MRKISFCVTLRNRWEMFRQLVASMSALEHVQQVELVVSDFCSTDINLRDAMRSTRFTSRLGQAKGFGGFNRSFGLNRSAAASTGEPEDIIFFVDADMWLPADFVATLNQYIVPGQCYFPICYSLYENKPREIFDDEPPLSKTWVPRRANGWWREEGWGNCGFTRADFADVGPWDEAIGKTYGKEDNDMARRANEKLVRHRLRCPGLYHLWHAPTPW